MKHVVQILNFVTSRDSRKGFASRRNSLIEPHGVQKSVTTWQEAQNGVTYAEFHITKLRLNLMTVLALSEMDS